MEQNTYKIIITNQLGSEQDRDEVIRKLASLFKLSEEQSTRLLSRPETVIKEQLDESTAKQYQLAINKTGAHSEIINTAEDALELPEIDEQIKPVNEQSLARDSREPGLDSVLATATKDPSRHHAENEKLELIDNFTEKHHCSECGAIKESKNAICLQCGAVPVEQKSTIPRLMGMLLKVVVVLLVLAIAGYFAMPFVKQFETQYRIKSGLSLAIDTRDKVTSFILNSKFWPNQNLDANLPKEISNEVIESIQLTGNGAFTVTMKPKYFSTREPQTLIFKPKTLRGKITWNCMEGTLDKKYRPDECTPRE